MSVFWVQPTTPLPDPRVAPAHGLLAAGHDLSVARLQEAYGKGIFPWYGTNEPVLWWSPDPRLVLFCDEVHCSRSLRKKLRQFARQEQAPHAINKVTINLAFPQVIQACAAPQPGREQTWITPDIEAVYTAWHREGGAHSVEVWAHDELVGGLYGVCQGRFFFGESMFSRVSDASKIALIYLVRRLQQLNIPVIDCQQETAHLMSLGARAIPRHDFLLQLQQQQQYETPSLGRGTLLQTGLLR